MKTPLLPDETLVHEAAANLQRGIETVGGRLFLTTHRLVFESHAFNVQTGSTVLDRKDIVSVAPCWTLFLGFLPLLPNSMAVGTSDGRTFRFVLWGRADWIRRLSPGP